MAKEYAKAFYNSKEWQRCRANVLKEHKYMCDRCNAEDKELICHHTIYLTPNNIHDPSISLNADLIEVLCIDCHNKEHHKDKTERRYEVDEQGRVIF